MPALTIAAQVASIVRWTPGLADEHVMRLFRQHEPAGARQRIEAALRQRRELHLAVAIGEEGEHEERQPVGRALIEGAENARVVHLPALALEQRLRLLAAILAEIFDQEIDHRPQMAAFLDIDLEQVAHVVEARRRCAQKALLLDRGRLGVALHDDEPAEKRAVLAWHFLPRRLALVTAEGNCAPLDLGREQNAPAIGRHLHIAELGPAGGIDADGGAQVNLGLLVADRAHAAPPIEIFRPPALERALKLLVGAKRDIVGNDLVVRDLDEAVGGDGAGGVVHGVFSAHGFLPFSRFPDAAARAA